MWKMLIFAISLLVSLSSAHGLNWRSPSPLLTRESLQTRSVAADRSLHRIVGVNTQRETLNKFKTCLNSHDMCNFRKNSQLFQQANNVFQIDALPWISSQSTKADGYEAVDELMQRLQSLSSVNLNSVANGKASEQSELSHKYAMVFFVSTMYEMTSFTYDYIFEQISKSLPYVHHVIGSTTGCTIGQQQPYSEPSETEMRPGISAIMIPIGDHSNIDAKTFSLVDDIFSSNNDGVTDLKEYRVSDGSVNILLSAYDQQRNLTALLQRYQGGKNIHVVGSVASSVTALQGPKVFRWSSSSKKMEKIAGGVVGIELQGDIDVKYINTNSCRPVGPVYTVSKGKDSSIISLDDPSKSGEDRTAPPLVHLADLFDGLSPADAFKLKEELLMAISVSERNPSKTQRTESFIQKPVSFDQMTGSIEIPFSTDYDGTDRQITLQYCVRDSSTARKDLQGGLKKFKSLISSMAAHKSNPLAVMLFGSIERGNKIFRYSNWESLSIYHALKDMKANANVPLVGLFGNGVLASNNQESYNSMPTILYSNSVIAVFSRKSNQNTEPTVEDTTSDENSEDVMTADEIRYFDDRNDGLIVTKRDTDSSHAVRVATMEFYVPEKSPQPSSILESIVWDREKEVDRFRERFQLTRALLQVRAATVKNPTRNFTVALQAMKLENAVPVLIELTRESLYNGVLPEKNLGLLSKDIVDSIPNIVSVGVNVDTSVYKGNYDDLEVVKASATLQSPDKRPYIPIICNDFVVYAYQIFQAKTKGADVIKLLASILPIQELSYLLKIAKSFNMTPIITVSSKKQLLEVCSSMKAKDIDIISITNRNQKLWKIQPNKAIEILSDPEVVAALNKVREAKQAENGDLLHILVEGFGSRDEYNQIKSRVGKDVDGIVLGEELLRSDRDIMGEEDGSNLSFVNRLVKFLKE